MDMPSTKQNLSLLCSFKFGKKKEDHSKLTVVTVLPSCPLFFEKGHFCLFKIATQGVSL
jgi:hypothetical protein